MARVVPSDIVKYLEKALSTVANSEALKKQFSVDSKSQPGLIQSVAALLRELDDAVLPKQPEDYVKFVAAGEVITSAARKAESGMTAVLDKLAGYGKQNPIAIVYDLLTQCPDDAIPKSTTDLSFITDGTYRDMLRKELVSIEDFLNARQWKAAMVIGGSLIEALLWFVLDSRMQSAVSSLQKLKQQGEIGSNIPNDLNRWYLKEYVKVAYDLGLLRDRTRDLSLLAGEYRNLIHAGKAVREKAECTRGAAFGVFGAVLEIIQDLTP